MNSNIALKIDTFPMKSDFESSRLSCDGTVMTSHNPSEKELDELHTLISDRLPQLKNSPLQQNIWGISTLKDAVLVSLVINTPYWHTEFRKRISNSPFIKFDGPSKPELISESVDSITELRTVKLQPDNPIFSVDSESATFTLTNGSERDIAFGVNYIIGFKGIDGLWYKLPRPGIWSDLGIILKPMGKHTIKTSLYPKLNNNKPGTYRLYKQIRFDGEKNHIWLMAEFNLN